MCDIIQSCENINIQNNANVILFTIVVAAYFILSGVLLLVENYNDTYVSYLPLLSRTSL